MRQRIRILSGGIAIALLGVGLSACDPTEAADPRLEPPLVRIATVQPAAPSERAFTGVISARIQSNLGFRVGGKIIERLVDTGQSVKLGQPLMKLDRADLDLQPIGDLLVAQIAGDEVEDFALTRGKCLQA